MHVVFSSNNLDASCMDSLLALIKIRKVVDLDLSHNNIGPAGSMRLVSELQNCEFSAFLNLTNNNIPQENVKIISHTAQKKQSNTSHLKIYL